MSSRLLFYIIFITLTFLGCSSHNPITNPTFPLSEKIISLSVGVDEKFTDGSPYSGTGVLGLFSLSINQSELKAELVPLRKEALMDVLEIVDITNFLQLAPCTDCVKIKSVSRTSDGNIVLSIGIKHPFQAGDPLKPITGRNRADLHVFNVEGTILSSSIGTTFVGIGESTAEFTLLNADGYSPYLDVVLDNIFPTQATIHPYILHFDDYSAGNYDPTNPMGFQSVTDPPPSGNLVMAMGCDYDYKDYVFKLKSGTTEFIYAVGCTYAVSAASKLQRFTPEYRIPQHNKKAASEIAIEIVSNNLRSGDTSSTAQIQIKVVDINHGVSVGSALNQMLADSSVKSILLEVPGVTSDPISVDISSPSGSGHSRSDPLIYNANITNAEGANEGVYLGLVKVTDNYSPGQNTSILLHNMDGIQRVNPLVNPLEGLFDISEFATYQTFTIEVATGNLPPVAILAPDPASEYQYSAIEFDATSSYDSDGSIVLYEFDFHYDGDPSGFTVEASNTTGIAAFEYSTPEDLMACVRVTDNMGAVAYDSVNVTILPCGDTIASWKMTLPQMNLGRRYPATIVVNDRLWFIGGESTTSVEVFDLETETWVNYPFAPLPSIRMGCAIAYFDGKIYCMGGYSGGTRTNTQVVYDIASNTWDSSYPNMPGPGRNVCRAVTYQGKIYLCYGLYDAGGVPTPCKRLDVYDPISKTWESGPDAPYGRSSPIWIVVGNKIWGFGNNNTFNPNPGYDRIEYYEPSSNSWTSLPASVTFARWRGSPAYIALGEKIYVVGGQQNANVNAYAWIDVFDTNTYTWIQEMDLPEDRGYDPGVAYYECELYVGGGGGDNMSILKTIRAAIFE